MAETDRPLSPHLQIWRWRLHMALSILHRATGMVNAIGALVVVWGMTSVAAGPAYFGFFLDLALSIPGRLVLFGLTFSLMLHLCTGIRHLIMDTGRMFDISANRKLGMAAVVAAIGLTLLVWAAAYLVAGAAA